MIEDEFLAETTEYEFKVAVEKRKAKTWLKSVCAFANGIGGTLIFGIDDNRKLIGLDDIKADSEFVSSLIHERITPTPEFILRTENIDGKDILKVIVQAGATVPYYYKSDGVMEAYLRLGNATHIAPPHMFNRLLLSGINSSFDSLPTRYNFNDFAFSKLRERYYMWTNRSMTDDMFQSFGIVDEQGYLSNAGALLADNSPIRHSRLFCTRWDGLDKSGGLIEALDSAEFSDGLIYLLERGSDFVLRNTKKRWMKTPGFRIEMPEYCEQSVWEALVNALVHRDYLEIGSEIHLDIYDDRLTIYSPGGMYDGTKIQDRDITSIPSKRRNPVIADIFGRLGLMERQGSGLKKIVEGYHAEHNYRPELEPKFYSEADSFFVTLYNLNYGRTIEETVLKERQQYYSYVKTEEQVRELEFIDLLKSLKNSKPTKDNMLKAFMHFGFDSSFTRADIMEVAGITATPATELMRKLKEENLIQSVKGRGRYMFVEPKS